MNDRFSDHNAIVTDRAPLGFSSARGYLSMRESMFFGEVPDFAKILTVVGRFEEDFNSPRRHDAGVEPQP